MTKPKFSRESFKQWLQKQPSTTRFKGKKYQKCPIGKYNMAFGREPWYAIDPHSSTWPWIFVDKLDIKQHINPKASFSPAQCLALLKEIPNA